MRWKESSAFVRAWRLFRTRNPETFTEKVRYKMLRDHRPLLVTFADKAAVRDFVIDTVGAQLLPTAYAILEDPQDLITLALPDSYVVKPTHGSGAAIVVSPAADPEQTLARPEWGWAYRHVHPDQVDREQLTAIAAGWIEKLYGQGPNREWAYCSVPRRVLVEEMLVSEDGGIPNDWKFFVFHGACQYVQVDTARFGGRTQDFYLPDWTHLPLSGGPPSARPPHPRPDALDQMIEIAERLASGIDFVRVDLYNLPDRIVFGELTSYPAGGNSPFDPEWYDAEFGSHWTVPQSYR